MKPDSVSVFPVPPQDPMPEPLLDAYFTGAKPTRAGTMRQRPMPVRNREREEEAGTSEGTACRSRRTERCSKSNPCRSTTARRWRLRRQHRLSRRHHSHDPRREWLGQEHVVKLLSGIVQPDGGTLLLDGTPFHGRRPADFQDAGFATVFQEVLIAPDRSVEDNILLGLDGLFHRRVPRSGDGRRRRTRLPALPSRRFRSISRPEACRLRHSS